MTEITKQRKKEVRATHDLIMAFHEQKPLEEILKINRELVKLGDNDPNFITSTLTTAINFNTRKNPITSFDADWFVAIENKIVEKYKQYEASWVFVSACILSAMGAPEVSEHVPRNVASFYLGMIIEEMISDSLDEGDDFAQVLIQVLKVTQNVTLK